MSGYKKKLFIASQGLIASQGKPACPMTTPRNLNLLLWRKGKLLLSNYTNMLAGPRTNMFTTN